MSRLTILHINIIGAVVILIVGVALYYTIITSAQDEVKKQQDAFNVVQGRADKLPTAKKNLQMAQMDKVVVDRDYGIYQAEYMPLMHYTGDRVKDMIRNFWPNNGHSWPERFITGVRAHMAAERKANGVLWLNPAVLTIPSYGPDPNAIDMGEHGTLTFGPYQMQVLGRNYDSLMRHIQDWNKIRGMGVPTIEQVRLDGNSPLLVVSYTVRFTLIMHEPIPKTDPKVGGGNGNGNGNGGGQGGGGNRGPAGGNSPATSSGGGGAKASSAGA